jgi:hypothetical protein
MMSAPSLTDSPTPDQPNKPQLSINNKRAQLEWEPVETSTMYAVERKRAGDDDKVGFIYLQSTANPTKNRIKKL